MKQAFPQLSVLSMKAAPQIAFAVTGVVGRRSGAVLHLLC